MNILNSLLIKIVSWKLLFSFIFVFVFSDYSYASKYIEQKITLESQESIEIPFGYGQVTDTYNPGNQKSRIIIIQDLHANYEVQRNIEGILKHLNENYGLSSIGLEGVEYDTTIDTSLIRTVPDEEIKREVLDYFMKQGMIKGAEAYASMSRDEPKLFGIEKKELYDEDVNILLSSLNHRPHMVEYLERLKYQLKILEDKVCSSELKKFRNQYILYKQERLPINTFHKYLTQWGEQVGKPIGSISSDYAKYISIIKKEYELDFKKLDKEYEKLLGTLNLNNEDHKLKNLYKGIKNFLQTPQALQEKMTRLVFNSPDYTNLRKYIEVVKESKQINTENLFKEAEKVVNTISYKLCKNKEEESLLFVLDYVQTMVKFLLNQITSTELDKFYKTAETFEEKFVELQKKYAQDCANIDSLLLVLKTYIQEMGAFYNIAKKRDEEFVKNINNELENSDKNVAVVIGGFHTDGVKELLKGRQIPYVTIAPRVIEYSEKDLKTYYTLLRGEIPISYSDIINSETLALMSFLHLPWFCKGVVLWGVKRISRQPRLFNRLVDWSEKYLKEKQIDFSFEAENFTTSNGENIFLVDFPKETVAIGVKGEKIRIIPRNEWFQEKVKYRAGIINNVLEEFKEFDTPNGKLTLAGINPLYKIIMDISEERKEKINHWLNEINKEVGSHFEIRKFNDGFYVYDLAAVNRKLRTSEIFRNDIEKYKASIEVYLEELVRNHELEKLKTLEGYSKRAITRAKGGISFTMSKDGAKVKHLEAKKLPDETDKKALELVNASLRRKTAGSEKSKAVAVLKKHDEMSGTLKDIGVRTLQDIINVMAMGEGLKAGWKEVASQVESKDYDVTIKAKEWQIDIVIPAKVIQVDNLPEGVTAYRFMAEGSRGEELIIVVRGPPESKIGQEAVFHELHEQYWTERLLSEFTGQISKEQLIEIAQLAHILASAEEVLEFSKEGQLTPYHDQQLSKLPSDKRLELKKENREKHHRIIAEYLVDGALVQINKYERQLRNNISKFQASKHKVNKILKLSLKKPIVYIWHLFNEELNKIKQENENIFDINIKKDAKHIISFSYFYTIIKLVISTILIKVGSLIPNLPETNYDASYLEEMHPIELFLLGGVQAPILEEITFRFVLFGGLLAFFRSCFKRLNISGKSKESSSFFLASTISVLIFVLLHETSNPVAIIIRFLSASIYTYAYWKSNNLIVPIMLHVMNNSIAFTLYFSPVIGGIMFGVTFITMLTRKIWLRKKAASADPTGQIEDVRYIKPFKIAEVNNADKIKEIILGALPESKENKFIKQLISASDIIFVDKNINNGFAVEAQAGKIYINFERIKLLNNEQLEYIFVKVARKILSERLGVNEIGTGRITSYRDGRLYIRKDTYNRVLKVFEIAPEMGMKILNIIITNAKNIKPIRLWDMYKILLTRNITNNEIKSMRQNYLDEMESRGISRMEANIISDWFDEVGESVDIDKIKELEKILGEKMVVEDQTSGYAAPAEETKILPELKGIKIFRQLIDGLFNAGVRGPIVLAKMMMSKQEFAKLKFLSAYEYNYFSVTEFLINKVIGLLGSKYGSKESITPIERLLSAT